ncbi:MAG: hypothetical protein A2Y62_22255 [Candidatus Fischerbacteria bacterium RBG_13_37_8]|uniref:RDD domain-containing protein n=1 Tax=Candidatus Fischerbacteria bacterium RBG_13_37_8 TaxID=1817863 RepID=A0A1F5VK39_9BACT|nr:MAG: hypothetical protein A2Y62_22255 [Candidatus Fischerbacteria bacterium RBG_13_37_8]
MKCTKCGFVSYDHLDVCKKCGKPLPQQPKVRQKSNVFALKIATTPKSTGSPAIQNKPKNVLKITQITPAPKQDIPVINVSPIPQSQQDPDDFFPLNEKNVSEDELSPLVDEDYGLITESPSEYLTLDNLPVLNRFIAGAIDFGALLFVNAVLILVSTQLIGVNLTALSAVKHYLIILFLLMYYLYYLYFTMLYQATPGKLMMKLRVISLASLKTTKLTIAQITWRWLGLIAGVAMLFGGFIYMLFDDIHATMHDRLSLSLVISKEQSDALQAEHISRS